MKIVILFSIVPLHEFSPQEVHQGRERIWSRNRPPALPELGITKTRLMISKTWITDGQITREWTGSGVDLSPGAVYADRLLQAAQMQLVAYMKRKVTTAPTPLKAILNELPGGWLTAFAVLKSVAMKDSASEEARLMAAWEEVHSVHGEDTTIEQIVDGAGVTES